MTQYDPLILRTDCCLSAILAALRQIGRDAENVSSDIFIGSAWTETDRKAMRDFLIREKCLANRVRLDPNLEPHEWYVECCGKRVGSKP